MRNPFRRVRRSRRPALVRPTAEQIKAAAQSPTPDERARRLLLAHLDEQQQATYRKAQYIEVVGSSGGRYCVHAEPHVYRIDAKGNHLNGYCSYVWRHWEERKIPRDDEVLTYLLLLQTDERRFIAVARPMSGSRHIHHSRRSHP